MYLLWVESDRSSKRVRVSRLLINAFRILSEVVDGFGCKKRYARIRQHKVDITALKTRLSFETNEIVTMMSLVRIASTASPLWSSTASFAPLILCGCREGNIRADPRPTSVWRRTFCWRIPRCTRASTCSASRSETEPSKTAPWHTEVRTRESTVVSSETVAFLGSGGRVGAAWSCCRWECRPERRTRDQSTCLGFPSALLQQDSAPKPRCQHTTEKQHLYFI